MLDTAWRQLRHGVALATGRRIRVDDVHALALQVARTQAEFGGLDRDRILEALGTSVSAEVREAVDARRWRSAVRAAYEHTAYYRDRLDRLGIAPDDLTLARRHELPPTTKSALRGLPEAFVSDAVSAVLQASTTGSTGTPTTCWFSAYELELAAGYSAMFRMLANGLGPSDTLQVSISSRATLAVHTTLRSAQLMGAGFVLTGIVDPDLTLGRLTTPVHLPGKKPLVSSLSINPSHLAEIVQLGEQRGYGPDAFGLREVLTGGEILSDALRRRAETLFGAPVQDTYGMTETFPVYGQDCTEHHLHFAAEQGLVEVLDPDTWQPTGPGEVGVLVVTPFRPYRETVPLLRYATGDLVRTLTTTPACELAGQFATSRLLGKADFSPGVGDGRLYQRDVLDLLEAEPTIPLPVRYRVEPVGDGFDLVVGAPDLDHAVVARLEDRSSAARLPIRKIVLTEDPDVLGPQRFHRALLREATAGRTGEVVPWTSR